MFKVIEPDIYGISDHALAPQNPWLAAQFILFFTAPLPRNLFDNL
jgi:hypothetical protein